MNKPVYVLGTGLSHDGSSCLLKDGEIIVAIEKERISRKKHDGGNDWLTVEYCLQAAGITAEDLSLVVQCANFEKEEIERTNYLGKRFFDVESTIPFVSISHHLAHAWSAVGTSPFNECNVIVIDGCGSFYNQCDDLTGAFIPQDVNAIRSACNEKDSFYFFDGKTLNPLFKDFSGFQQNYHQQEIKLPFTIHSIGGLYAMAANYCFGSFEDAGKLMGLAPYGKNDVYSGQLFKLQDGRIWVNEDLLKQNFTSPANLHTSPLSTNFQHYANIAKWVQDETEKAILYLFKHRLAMHPHPNICYAGGVALNAVSNSKLKQQSAIQNFYIEPAAGDNGLAIGCAFYGWMEVLKKEKVAHNGNTFFGKEYSEREIEKALNKYPGKLSFKKSEDYISQTAFHLSNGKTIGWFQLGCEFGPRALGRRSILADPKGKDIQNHINNNIKFREDFRPFAPAVLFEDKDVYFNAGFESPYMILIDSIKNEWKDKMPGVVHVDGTCRVQTVKDKSEPFYKLLQQWKKISGISVLLNTSFNKKGMPIVETPAEAIDFFLHGGLDILVLHNYIVTKND